MTLSDSTILITGGSGGIGFALARQLVQRRNRIIICGRGAEALARAQTIEPALITRICDLADAGSRRTLIDWLAATHPDLSVVFNNTGVQYRRSFTDEHALDDLAQEVAVNFTAPVQLTGEILPLLRRQPIVDTGLGGDALSDGMKNGHMMSPDAFATEALALLDEGRDEVLVGLSIGTRQQGEKLFERMNGG
jgi:uncharacterized oxidoreductase